MPKVASTRSSLSVATEKTPGNGLSTKSPQPRVPRMKGMGTCALLFELSVLDVSSSCIARILPRWFTSSNDSPSP